MFRLWAEIPGYEHVYQVSTFGEVRNVQTGKMRKLHADKDGYLQVTLYTGDWQGTHKVHRLVAAAFIPNPANKPEVNHKDYDRANNRKDNLEWATRLENRVVRVLPHGPRKELIATTAVYQRKFASSLEAKAAGFTRSRISAAVKTGKPYRGYVWSHT